METRFFDLNATFAHAFVMENVGNTFGNAFININCAWQKFKILKTPLVLLKFMQKMVWKYLLCV